MATKAFLNLGSAIEMIMAQSARIVEQRFDQKPIEVIIWFNIESKSEDIEVTLVGDRFSNPNIISRDRLAHRQSWSTVGHKALG